MSAPPPSRSPAGSEQRPSRASEAPVRQRSWVILACIPDVVDDEKFMPGTDFVLELEDPPRTTNLTVPRRIAPDPKDSRSFPYVVDVDPSGRFLLYTTHGERFAYYLCDAHTGVATRLPTEASIFPPGSVGLIEDPRHCGHYMAAKLHPTSSEHHETLVYNYAGAKGWALKELASSPHHQPWDSHGGALAHDGKLWWVDLAYGLLTCDPFVDRPDLRFDDVWADDSYTAAGLPQHKVPAIALIHPKNYGIVYFFLDSRSFSMDMRATQKRVLECENFETRDEFHTARFVHAWELPPTLLRLDLSIALMKRNEEYFSLPNLLMDSEDDELRALTNSETQYGQPPTFGGNFKTNLRRGIQWVGDNHEVITETGEFILDCVVPYYAKAKFAGEGFLKIGRAGKLSNTLSRFLPEEPVPEPSIRVPELFVVDNLQDAKEFLNRWQQEQKPDYLVDVSEDVTRDECAAIYDCFCNVHAAELIQNSPTFLRKSRSTARSGMEDNWSFVIRE